MQIKGFAKTSYVDYPGKICSVVFLGGCNFRCRYCYNKDLVFNADTLNIISEQKVFDHLEKRKDRVGGVCITGGEPTLTSGLPDFIQRLSEFNLPIKLDTNGTNPVMLKKLLESGFLDYVAVDFKAPFDLYTEFTNTKRSFAGNIQKSFRLLAGSDTKFEVRTTVIQRYHTQEVLVQMAEELSSLFSGFSNDTFWYLQQFFPGGCIDEEYNEYGKTEERYLKDSVELLKRKFPSVEVRGVI